MFYTSNCATTIFCMKNILSVVEKIPVSVSVVDLARTLFLCWTLMHPDNKK